MKKTGNWVCRGWWERSFLLFYKVVLMWKVSLGFRETLEPGEIFLSMMALTLVCPPPAGTEYGEGAHSLRGCVVRRGTWREYCVPWRLPGATSLHCDRLRTWKALPIMPTSCSAEFLAPSGAATVEVSAGRPKSHSNNTRHSGTKA